MNPGGLRPNITWKNKALKVNGTWGKTGFCQLVTFASRVSDTLSGSSAFFSLPATTGADEETSYQCSGRQPGKRLGDDYLVCTLSLYSSSLQLLA